MNWFLTDREGQYVRWWDYLWLAIPIAGLSLFMFAVKDRERREESRP